MTWWDDKLIIWEEHWSWARFCARFCRCWQNLSGGARCRLALHEKKSGKAINRGLDPPERFCKHRQNLAQTQLHLANANRPRHVCHQSVTNVPCPVPNLDKSCPLQCWLLVNLDGWRPIIKWWLTFQNSVPQRTHGGNDESWAPWGHCAMRLHRVMSATMWCSLPRHQKCIWQTAPLWVLDTSLHGLGALSQCCGKFPMYPVGGSHHGNQMIWNRSAWSLLESQIAQKALMVEHDYGSGGGRAVSSSTTRSIVGFNHRLPDH